MRIPSQAGLLLLLLGILAPPTLAADVKHGEKLARKVCGRCHAVDPKVPWNSIGSTPSFMLMAKKLDRYRDRVLSVTNRRPHIAQRLEVKNTDLEDILAYIETLRPN